MNMKNQAYNPILPGWEYIPDGEPHIFGDRVYLYGSHDRFDGDNYCLNNYVCWSAPIDDLSDWQFHGQIYDITSDPLNINGEYCGYAPDCCKGPDGRYYLYYALNNHLAMSVAVCDTPCGKFEFFGHMKTDEGRVYGTEEGDAYVFDPGVIVDDDGRIHLYMGFSPTDGMEGSDLALFLKRWNTCGCHYVELCDDMLTMKTAPQLVVPGCAVSNGTCFEGHSFFEAPSIRKFFGKYYFIYSSELFHELCYAVSDTPEGPFEYKGILVSNGDVGINGRSKPVNHIGNNHGSLIEIKGKFYIFYHRHTNNSDYSRQACAEEIHLSDDHTFIQAEITSCGLNTGPLKAYGKYSANIACNLSSCMESAPYLTQNGTDREEFDDQYIKNITNGAFAGFKYFDFKGGENICIEIRADGEGIVKVSQGPQEAPFSEIKINKCSKNTEFFGQGLAKKGVFPLYFTYCGSGSVDLISFKIIKGK